MLALPLSCVALVSTSMAPRISNHRARVDERWAEICLVLLATGFISGCHGRLAVTLGLVGYCGRMARNINLRYSDQLSSGNQQRRYQMGPRHSMDGSRCQLIGNLYPYSRPLAPTSSPARQRLTIGSTRTPPALPSALSQHFAISASFCASVQAVPVSLIR